MVEDPDPGLADFVSAGCGTVIVHVETCQHLHRTLSRIRDLGARAGVAVNPSTSLDFVPYVLDQLDQILIMTVNPGFGGQEYIDAMEDKVSEAREIADRSERPIQIEVDGGISAKYGTRRPTGPARTCSSSVPRCSTIRQGNELRPKNFAECWRRRRP